MYGAPFRHVPAQRMAAFGNGRQPVRTIVQIPLAPFWQGPFIAGLPFLAWLILGDRLERNLEGI